MSAHEIILIGCAETAVSVAANRILDGFIYALQEFDTETLLAVAELRDEIQPDGWMQRLIREYVDVWR